jgi:hypothetical protein
VGTVAYPDRQAKLPDRGGGKGFVVNKEKPLVILVKVETIEAV